MNHGDTHSAWPWMFSKAFFDGLTCLPSIALAIFFPLPTALDTILDASGSEAEITEDYR